MHPSRQLWLIMDEQFGISNSSGTSHPAINALSDCRTASSGSCILNLFLIAKENKLACFSDYHSHGSHLEQAEQPMAGWGLLTADKL